MSLLGFSLLIGPFVLFIVCLCCHLFWYRVFAFLLTIFPVIATLVYKKNPWFGFFNFDSSKPFIEGLLTPLNPPSPLSRICGSIHRLPCVDIAVKHCHCSFARFDLMWTRTYLGIPLNLFLFFGRPRSSASSLPVDSPCCQPYPTPSSLRYLGLSWIRAHSHPASCPLFVLLFIQAYPLPSFLPLPPFGKQVCLDLEVLVRQPFRRSWKRGGEEWEEGRGRGKKWEREREGKEGRMWRDVEMLWDVLEDEVIV